MASVAVLPSELQQIVFTLAANALFYGEHLHLLLISQNSYDAVSRVAYKFIRILSRHKFFGLLQFLDSSVPFAQRIESLYVCIPGASSHYPSRALSWPSLLQKLPNLTHICVGNSDSSREKDRQESFQALMSRPRLWNLRIDWKLDKQLIGTALPNFEHISHLTLALYPDLDTLATFRGLTHLMILNAGDIWTGALIGAVAGILRSVQTLQLLVLSDEHKVISSRFNVIQDSRIVCQFRPKWSVLADAKDWEKFTRCDLDCIWTQAESIVDERRRKSGGRKL